MDTSMASKTDLATRDVASLIRKRRRRRNISLFVLFLQHIVDNESLAWIIQGVTFVILLSSVSCTWCNLDTGFTTITDGHGYPHSVFISVTRDGGVWLRAGKDFMSDDWVYTNEYSDKYQSTLLSQQTLAMLPSLNYTASCVQTDLDLKIRMDAGWHPSYIKTYVPTTKAYNILSFRHNKDCYFNTTLSISANKQGLTCEGGSRNACGLKHLPQKDTVSVTTFLTFVAFDPEGRGHFRCKQQQTLSSYTFHGSYYHVYVKLGSCPRPTDSRMLGHEAKLRPHNDNEQNIAIIPDSSQTAFASGVIIGWHVYAKVISFQHEVYLQVWRPHHLNKNQFMLIAQTFFHPNDLRFLEVKLQPNESIHVQKGDVLGLYFKMENPVPYTTTPCALPEQYLKRLVNIPRQLDKGHSYIFESLGSGKSACRQYSFTANLANKSDAKVIEDWHCPSPESGKIDKESQVGSRTIAGSDKTNNSPDGVTKKPSVRNSDKPHERTDMVLPVHYILAIIGGLLVLMIIIGGIAYYRAIKSD